MFVCNAALLLAEIAYLQPVQYTSIDAHPTTDTPNDLRTILLRLKINVFEQHHLIRTNSIKDYREQIYRKKLIE